MNKDGWLALCSADASIEQSLLYRRSELSGAQSCKQPGSCFRLTRMFFERAVVVVVVTWAAAAAASASEFVCTAAVVVVIADVLSLWLLILLLLLLSLWLFNFVVCWCDGR